MAYSLFDYLDAHGNNCFADWSRKQQKVQRAKLNAKIDMLAMHGEELLPHTLTDTPVRGIRKLRVKGSVQLRPLLCRGPHGDSEYTFLLGAIEVGDEFQPKDAPSTADDRKAVVSMNIGRRCAHERIN